MAVVGLDFGNLSVLIGQAGRGGVDVILNDSSNRQTASYVSIQGKQRFLGDSGSAMARSNITNTFHCMKQFVGRKFDSPDVQKELLRAPFKAGKLPNGGVGLLVHYNNEDILVSAEHVMAMVLVKAKEVAKNANSDVDIADAVIAVPHWFTDSQRRGVLHACEIVKLNCLKVANESALIALSYGIFKSAKKMFSETEPAHTMFIDIGYTGYCVTIVDFIQENMKVLATVCDRDIGGRDFDDVIIEFLAEAFQKKTGINVRGNVKAQLKLQAAAEKAKKTLSPNGVSEAAVSVECLSDDKDLSVILTKDEFESRSASLIAQLEVCVLRCLEEASLSKSDLHEVEIVGGTSRVGIVKRRLGEILGLDPSAMNFGLKTTMNSDEAVARGGALQCAMLSGRMKVKPFNMVDKLPYGIVVHYNTAANSDPSDYSAKGESARLYVRGDDLPRQPERLTFENKSADFVLTAFYDEMSAEVLPKGEDKLIAKYTIKVPADLVSTGPKSVRVSFALDKHGCLFVQSAELMEEITEADSPVADEKMEVTEGAVEEKPKFKKHDLVVVTESFGLTKDQMKAAIEMEVSMAFEDKLITETADKRNELEAYLYGMRDKLDGSLKEFGTGAEKDKLKDMISSAEDWLYGDGFDSTKHQYARKIEELKALSDPIESRLAEDQQRGNLLEKLKEQMDLCKVFANSKDEGYAHITDDERDVLRNEVVKTEGWMNEQTSLQNKLGKSVTPILTAASITKVRNDLFKVSSPVMTKPKPKPVVVNTESKDTPQSEEKSHAEEKTKEKDEKEKESSEGKDDKHI